MSLLLDIARLSLEILSWPHGNRFSTSFLSVCLRYNCQRYIRTKQMQMICSNHRYSIECQNFTLGSSLGFELFQRIPESHGILEGDERQLEALVRRNKRWIGCWEQFMYLVHTRGWYMLRCFLLEDLEDRSYLPSLSLFLYTAYSFNKAASYTSLLYSQHAKLNCRIPLRVKWYPSREFGVFQIWETFLSIADWRRDSGDWLIETQFWHDFDFSETAMDTSGETARNLVILL